MRLSISLMALTAVCFSISLASDAVAGHGHGSHSQQNNPAKEFLQQHHKVLTGSRGGVGFIADPVPRVLQPRQQSPNVTKIVDPIRPLNGKPPATGGSQTTTATTNLIAIQPSPAKTNPVVRDHTLTKPPVKTNPYANPPTVTGGSGLHFVNPFSFTAPIRPGTIDHRTPGYPRGGGHGRVNTPFQPNSQGPANSR